MLNSNSSLHLCTRALAEFAGKRVMVIGDLMLDEHIWGTAARISPEAPVMVVQVDAPGSDCRPGGAANVANNIRALGAEATVVGVIGDDEGGSILLSALQACGADTSGVFIDPNRPTTRKTRIWASRRHQVVRVDWESRRGISRSTMADVLEFISSRASGVDSLLLSDYDKGVITRDTARAAITASSALGKTSASNAKPHNLRRFGGIGVVTLNQSEAAAASGMDIETESDVEKAAGKLMRAVSCGGLVITRGAHGLSVFEDCTPATHIPALETEVYDVAGAGDTVISALVLGMSCGLPLPLAATLANCAGGAVVRKVGVATTGVQEILGLLEQAQQGNGSGRG